MLQQMDGKGYKGCGTPQKCAAIKNSRPAGGCFLAAKNGGMII
jgi:hypothetical protein